MKNQEKGFTLIELMIVVAIMAILASVALPSYQDYTIRSQIAEGLGLAGPAQRALITYNNDHGNFPADNNEAGVGPAAAYRGKYTTSVSVSGSVISIRFGNSAHNILSGNSITLTAQPANGSISWVCGTDGSVPAKYVPRSCL